MPKKVASLEDLLARDTVAAARAMLGATLIRRFADGRVVNFRICETEAYDGFHDRASHASRGMTARNAPMFGPHCVWYVYLCYGMHEMLNLVTREAGYPAAVLIRGVQELDDAGAVLRRIDGPGRVTKALGVHRKDFNGRPADETTGLRVSPGVPIPACDCEATPRIGVDYAGPEWAAMPWRFVVKKSGGGVPPPVRKTRSGG